MGCGDVLRLKAEERLRREGSRPLVLKGRLITGEFLRVSLAMYRHSHPPPNSHMM